MNVEAVSFKNFYKNKENIYKNIMLVSKRARQIVDQRFMEMETLLNIEDTEQLNEIDNDIIGKPKSISIAMDELLDNDLEYSTFSDENEENEE
jgi:DNA-directed RNA polymerase subunit K/omega